MKDLPTWESTVMVWCRWCGTYLLAIFHSSAGFWELLSPSDGVLPFVPSPWGCSCSHCAVPTLMLWRSIWYWRSSTSDPGSRRTPRFIALLKKRRVGLLEWCPSVILIMKKGFSFMLSFQYLTIGYASLCGPQKPLLRYTCWLIVMTYVSGRGCSLPVLKTNSQSPHVSNTSYGITLGITLP